jgi:hypothetical protein
MSLHYRVPVLPVLVPVLLVPGCWLSKPRARASDDFVTCDRKKTVAVAAALALALGLLRKHLTVIIAPFVHPSDSIAVVKPDKLIRTYHVTVTFPWSCQQGSPPG